MTRLRRLATIASILLLAAGCSDDGPGRTGSGPVGTVFSAGVGEPPPTLADPIESTEAPAGSYADVSVALEVVTTAAQPMALVQQPGTDLILVAEREGTVRPLLDGELGPPAVDISDDVLANAERGLLSMAFSPDGTRLYLSFSDLRGSTRVDEFEVNGEVVNPFVRRTIFELDQPAGNHNGGHIVFGPDEYLYLGLGDGGGSGDTYDTGQDPLTPLGSILRIDPTSDAAGNYGAYGIPANNPFAVDGGTPEIYVWGLRNPWRFSFDFDDGALWVADVGQDVWEEINRLPARGSSGANLGWPLQEGRHDLRGGIPDNYVPPIAEYHHDFGCSITGGYVYRGDAIPDLEGAYVFGDYCTAQLWALPPDLDAAQGIDALGVEFDDNLVSFAVDNDGELYALTTVSISKLVRG